MNFMPSPDLMSLQGNRMPSSLPAPAAARPAPNRSSTQPSSSKPIPPRPAKPIKISPKLQNILDNHANFLKAVESAQTGVKVKLAKGKGLAALEKWDLKKQSELFKGYLVAVVHHISAKPEHLVPRWAVVSYLCRSTRI
jgi:hypothetical protein